MHWRKIEYLKDKYQANLLLCAPELVNLDCNEHGIGLGYWQDDVGWLCCTFNMTNDEWDEVLCHPTHFLILKGPSK